MDQGKLDLMLTEMWNWLDGPGRSNADSGMSSDRAAYGNSFDRAIALEQLKALAEVKATLERIATALERAYPRHPSK